MGFAWTDFEQCVNDRISYYDKQYEQGARAYARLLKAGGADPEQLEAILFYQQAVADELSRLHRLLSKYSRSAGIPVPIGKMPRVVAARLN